MKITQEVRDFAAKQEAGMLNTPPPYAGEGQAGAASQGEGASAADAGSGSSPSELEMSEAQAGMAQMSEKYREIGSELYIGAGRREHE